MSKAILVIDMPKHCKDCQFRVAKHYNQYEYDFWCEANNEMFKGLKKDFTPKNFKCPLKPLPQKKKLDEDLFLSNNFNFQYARFNGYNECLDEILGEKNDE